MAEDKDMNSFDWVPAVLDKLLHEDIRTMLPAIIAAARHHDRTPLQS